MFILGGTDDIQVLLDDSQVSMERKGKEEKGEEGGKGGLRRNQANTVHFGKYFSADTIVIISVHVNPSPILSQVNISTIAGSQHMGPIKSRVDELNLFSETLVGSVTHTFC